MRISHASATPTDPARPVGAYTRYRYEPPAGVTLAQIVTPPAPTPQSLMRQSYRNLADTRPDWVKKICS